MTFKELRYLWWSDVYRRAGKISLWAFLKMVLFIPENKVLFWLRLTIYLRQRPIKNILWPFYMVSKLMSLRYQRKYGILINETTVLGSGMLISHMGCIAVGGVIGKNCNITHGVTIGHIRRGRRAGLPVVGDNVYIGAGAKVLGGIHVGDRAAIGANCVVIDDVPDDGVVVGVPGKVVSHAGSEGYINKTDYAEKLGWSPSESKHDESEPS